jgi:hypothetical protein
MAGGIQPIGGGGMQNLGGATFQIAANTVNFVQGMKVVQQQAQQTVGAVNQSFGQLLGIPRQLAAINQTAMSTTAAVQLLTEKLGRLQGAARQAQGSMHGFGGAGQGLLTIAYLVDDLQYGFRAIINNIPQLGMAIGSAMGLSTQATMAFAGALGIAAVAVNLIIDHWGTLNNLLTSIVYDKPLSELEKLRAKAEEAAEAFDKMTQSATRPQAIEAKGVQDLFKKHGEGKVLAELSAKIAADPAMRSGVTRGENDKLRAANAIQVQNPQAAANLRQEVADARAGRDRKKAAGLMGEALIPGEKGDRARALVGHKLGGQIGNELDQLTPAGQKRAEQFKKQAEARKEVQARIKAETERKNREMEGQAGDRGRVEKLHDDEKKKAADENRKMLLHTRRERDRIIMGNVSRDEQTMHNARRLRGILKPDEQRGQAGIMGITEFANRIATGGVDMAQKTREKQLETLEKIRDFLEDMDMQAKRNQAQVAIAAGD